MPLRRSLSLVAVVTLLTGLAPLAAPRAGAAPSSAAPLSTAAADYRPLSPTRLFDTRKGLNVVKKPLSASKPVTVTVAGRAGLPATGIGAVVIDLGAVSASAVGGVSVYASGASVPSVASMRVTPKRTDQTLVVTEVASNGTIALRNDTGKVQAFGDVVGWFPTGSGMNVLPPTTVLDTAAGVGVAAGPLGTTATVPVTIAGQGGVPTGAGGTVVLSVRARNATLATDVTIWPTGDVMPGSPQLSVRPPLDEQNLAFVPVAPDGTVSVHNAVGRVDVAVTIVGFLPAANGYTPIVPQSVLDTRTGVGAAKAQLKAKATVNLTVGGVGAVPLTGVTAVVVQLGVISASGTTDLTAWTTGTAMPAVPSTGPAKKGEVEQNTAIVPLDATGRFTVRNKAGKADVTADVVGYFGDTVSGTWRFVPDTVTLTATGQVQSAQLTEFAADGTVITTQPPTGVTSTAVGDPGVATIVDRADGSTQMTATATIGSTVRAYTVPGQSAPVPLTVMNVRLAGGVQLVARANVFFPPPDLPDGVDPLTAGLPGISANGIGPFTLTEIGDRANLTAPIDPANPGTPTIYVPWVLKGGAPATGTVVLGGGGDNLFGRVVEPAGRPTITRSGYALITVATVPFGSVYDQVKWDVDSQQLGGVGFRAVGAPEGPAATAAVPAKGTASPPAPSAFTRAVRRSIGAARPSGPAPSSASKPPTAQPSTSSKSAKAAAPAAPTPRAVSLSDCTSELGASFGSLTLTPPNFQLLPVFVPTVDYDAQGNRKLDVRLGYSLNINAGFSGVIQFTGTLQGSCKLSDLGRINVAAVFLGQLAPLLDFYADANLKLSYNITVSGGPKAEIGASCSLTHRATVGLSYTEGVGLSTLPSNIASPTAGCTGVARSTGLVANAATVDASLTVGAEVPLGVKFGGRVVGYLGFLFGRDDLGDLQVAALENFGPRAHLVWDSDQTVLLASDTASFVGLDLAPSVSIKAPGLDAFVKTLTGGLFGLPSISIAPPPITLAALYKAVEPRPGSPLQVSVNGVDQLAGPSDVVNVTVGDTINVVAPFRSKQIPLAPEPTVVDGSAWIANGPSWTAFDAFSTLQPAGLQLGGQASVTQAVCDTIGTTPKEIRLLANAPMFGALPTSGFAGSFQVKCTVPSMEFVPTALDLSVADSKLSDSAALVPQHLGGSSWELVDAPDWPAWLTDNPSSGTFDAQDSAVDIAFTANCSKVTPRRVVTYTVQARTLDPAIQPAATASLPITADCRPAYVEWKQREQIGTGNVFVETFGKSSGRWDLDPATLTTAPQWLRINGVSGGPVAISPLTGVYTPGKSLFTVGFTVTSRPSTCRAQAARSHDITILTTYITGPTEDRGKDTITITQPAVPGDPSKCNGANAYSSGDPHLGTFDGNAFDAQVLGEYVYVEPLAGAVGPTLHVRQELTNPTSQSVFKPTSITAVSVDTEGHRVEVYERPTPGTVYIDGVATTLADGVPVALTDTMSVVRTGSSIVVTSSEIDLTVLSRGYILDINVSVARGAPVRGLIGTPDGNAANDLATRGGTTYALAQVRQHSTELYAITDSWRITDPANSTFTVAYAGFNDPNLPYDAAALAPFRAQVVQQLGSITAICDAGGGASAALIDQLAAELAIGRPLGELSRYTCSYLVDGTARAGTGAAASTVPGAEVTVDAPGLAPCVTTSSTTGTYSCRLVPDFNELSSSTAMLPLPITAQARWNGSPTVIATNTIQLGALAGLATQPATATLDLAVDPAALPTLALSGTFVDNNGPVTRDVPMTVTAFDAANNVVANTYDFVRPAADGTYAATRSLPRGAVRADVVFQIGPAVDWITNRATGLVDGSNPFTFDVDQRVPTVNVSGTMTGLGGAALGANVVAVLPYDANGTALQTFLQYVQPDPIDGSYSFSRDLPRAAAKAVVTTNYGVIASDATTLTVDPLRKGPNAIVLSVDYRPAVVQLSGTMTLFGQSFFQPVPTVFEAFAANGTSLRQWQQYPDIFNPTGSYSLNERLPLGTVRVDVTAKPTNNPIDYQKISATNLQPGLNPATLSFDFAPPIVDVSGVARVNGAPATGSVLIDFVQYDANGNQLGQWTADASTQSTIGMYSTSLTLTSATTRVVMNAWLQADPNQKVQAVVSNMTTGGRYSATADLDIQTLQVTVRGTISSLGVPIANTNPAATLRFTAEDANGQPIYGYSANHLVLTGNGGSYSLNLAPPLTARTIVASAEIQTGPYGIVVYVPGRFAVQPGVNDVVFSPDTMLVEVTGTALDNGQPIGDFSGGSDNSEFDLSMQVPDGQGGYTVTNGLSVNYDYGTGAYSMLQALPAVPQARFCTDETFVVCTAVVPLGGGQHGLTLDFDIGTVAVTLTGAVTDGGGVWNGGSVTVNWVAYDFDPNNYAANPPYQQVARQDDVPVDVSNGPWQIPVNLPGAARFVVVTVNLGNGQDFSRTFERTGTPNETFTFDVERQQPWLLAHVRMTLDQPCSTNVAIRQVRLWALPEPHADYDFNNDSWPGALVDLGTFWVVPDPVTGDYQVNVPLPPGTESVGWKHDTPDIYAPGTYNYGGVTAFDGVQAGQTYDVGFTDQIGCYG